MRAVVQRVTRACVTVPDGEHDEIIGAIESGFLVLVGIHKIDTDTDAQSLAAKIVHLRVFDDYAGKLNLSLLDTGGSALVVSNFTLYGDCRKGRRPSFTESAGGPRAEGLYVAFGAAMAAFGIAVQYGRFGAKMRIDLVNDGPITLLLDSHHTV